MNIAYLSQDAPLTMNLLAMGLIGFTFLGIISGLILNAYISVSTSIEVLRRLSFSFIVLMMYHLGRVALSYLVYGTDLREGPFITLWSLTYILGIALASIYFYIKTKGNN